MNNSKINFRNRIDRAHVRAVFVSIAIALVCFALSPAVLAQDGAVGDGTSTDRFSPVQVAGLTGMTAVAAGTYHSLALKSDDAGEITEVEEEARREPPLTAFKFENNRLSFDWKDSDDTTRFEMRVTGERTAEVRTVADPAPLRPFRLAKIAESPQN